MSLRAYDFSHLPARSESPRIAVTPLQHELVAAAKRFRERHGHWPRADKLAVFADAALPIVWAELKVLAKLGVIEWGKTAKVVRDPDGFFLSPDTAHAFTSAMSRGCEPQ